MIKAFMGKRGLINLPQRLEIQARMASAFARAAATAATRHLDETLPLSWEFSGFSQHGEDGIIDYLCTRMTTPNRYFVEIGASDGLQNCSAWLAYARRFGGVMVEGNPRLTRYCTQVLHTATCHNVEAVNQRVDRASIVRLMKQCPYTEPDVFMLDIDGIDFYLLEAVLDAGFRPKLLVVEYNSVFGPEQAVTIPYDARFSRQTAHPSRLYYGVSIAGWRNLLETRGYVFITVESNGTNAFFIHPDAFPNNFVDGLAGMDFRDNQGDRNGATEPFVDHEGDRVLPVRDWRQQFALIRDEPLVVVQRDDT